MTELKEKTVEILPSRTANPMIGFLFSPSGQEIHQRAAMIQPPVTDALPHEECAWALFLVICMSSVPVECLLTVKYIAIHDFVAAGLSERHITRKAMQCARLFEQGGGNN
jgi:hypothetical protein